MKRGQTKETAEAWISGARRLALFMDYDGTIVPIAGRPGDARTTPRVMRLLRRLERTPGVTVVLVTGRDIKSFRPLVPLRRTWFVGIHGSEIARGPGPIRYLVPVATARAAARRIEPRLRMALNETFTIENKGVAVALHYRLATVSDRRRGCRLFLDLIAPYRRRRVLGTVRGKGSLEARPFGAHKGLAVSAVLGRKAGARTAMIAMGDDETDEYLFRAVRRRGGYAVGVGDRPKRVNARLKNPAEVIALLEQIQRLWSAAHKGK